MNSERKMLVWLARVIVIVFVLVAMRFFYLQVIKASELQKEATQQRVKEIVETPERGKIVDRNGNILAMSLMAQDIAVYPNIITSPERQKEIAKMLADTLDLKYSYVLKQIQSKNPKDKSEPAKWALIARQVDPEKAYKIKQKNIGGIQISQSPKRFYPNGALASSIIGFVNSNNQAGAGLEVGMNSYLAGVPGYTVAETDNYGKTIPIGLENISSPVEGQDVHLSIDNYIQYVLEKRLKKAMKEMNPHSIHGVVMDPNTGEVLAMASYPSFDPTKYQKSKSNTWNNSVATFVYEPGSTFKPTFMAQALEQGTITPEFRGYDGLGYVNVQGSNIKNWDGRPLGDYDLKEVIQTSSNVGMIAISKTMTSKQIVDGLHDAGFGAKTGIELPGEEIGLFPTEKSLNSDPIRKATVSFGQGISTTPIQLISAFSTLINGGYQVKPKLVESVKDEFGNDLYESGTTTKKRVYSQKTVDAMKSYLHFNQTDGSGKDYQIEGYDGGAKTGSAWVVENGVYKRGVIIGSFIGFAPLDHPKYAMLIVVDQPNGIEFGGPSAGPIYHDVMKEILRYKGVPKKNEKAEKTITVPDVKWKLVEDAKEEVSSKVKNATIKITGKGQVVTAQSYAIKNDTLQITLQTKKIKEGKEYIIPSFVGKSKEEVEKMLKDAHVKVTFHGEGMIKEQDVKPGHYDSEKELNFWLK